MLLGASLGLSLNVPERRVVLNQPQLPESTTSLRIEGLQFGDTSVELSIERRAGNIHVDVVEPSGTVDAVVNSSAAYQGAH